MFETKYGRIGIMICADNNHPEPARILALKGAQPVYARGMACAGGRHLAAADSLPRAGEQRVCGGSHMYCKMDDLFLFGTAWWPAPGAR
ncbi:MAG: nitrilase-related carbon-nitrogen hydrolase [Ruthenibacterium sp.]